MVETPAPAQLQVELGAMEGSPIALDDDDVGGLRQAGRQLAPVGGPVGAAAQRLVDIRGRRIGEIGREGDMHQYDDGARGAERPRQRLAGGQRLGARARLGRHADDAVLQVDEHERGGLGIEFDGHAALRVDARAGSRNICEDSLAYSDELRSPSQMSSAAAPARARVPIRARGHARVAAILDAGAALFAEKGFDAATMTEIAARSRTAIGSLYRFFPTKMALADALLARYAETLSANLAALEARAQELSEGAPRRLSRRDGAGHSAHHR